MEKNIEAQRLTLHEFVKEARLKLSQYTWDYIIGAAESETTMRRNRMALDSLAFRPRVLRDVSHVDASHDFLGKRIRLPVALAPVGSVESFAEGGAASAARGAGAFGVPLFVSSVTQPGLEKVAEASDGPKVFQLYVRGDDAFVDDYAARTADAGYDAFCVTVDSAVYSRRERDISKRWVKYWRAANTGMEYQASLNWGNIERLRKRLKLPLILKGIATAEDAVQAVEVGADVVYVSNHGGRQLDFGRGSADVLPEVIDAVAGRAKVYVDGGFCRGTDVLKGIALGADLVVMGRMYLYALAAGGADALVNMLEVLESEISIDLALLGVTSPSQLDRGFVHAAPPVNQPGVHSAFPLLTFNEGY